MRFARRAGILNCMNERCLRALQDRRTSLHSQWASRLRAAPFNSPLAHPDTLIHLMDRTLDQIFHELNHPSARRRQPALPHDFCRCGHNPLVTYFATAALAFQTSLAQCADEVPVSRDDVEEVNRTLTRIARREIMTFCALCLRRADEPAHAHTDAPPCNSGDNQAPTA